MEVPTKCKAKGSGSVMADRCEVAGAAWVLAHGQQAGCASDTDLAEQVCVNEAAVSHAVQMLVLTGIQDGCP